MRKSSKKVTRVSRSISVPESIDELVMELAEEWGGITVSAMYTAVITRGIQVLQQNPANLQVPGTSPGGEWGGTEWGGIE
jgi:hypothetical protein